MERAIFYCNLPPPYTGQTVGTEVVARLLEDRLDIARLNTSDARSNLDRGPLAAVGRALSMVRHGLALRRELRREPADILYFVVSSSALGQLRDALTVTLARRHVRRIVAHVRSGDYDRNFERLGFSALSRLVVRRTDALIFLSRHLAELAASCVPDAKRRVVFNAIDDEVRLTAAEARAKIDSRADRERLRVVFISNMIPSKGYFDLARALAELGAATPVEADFVGAWPTPDARRELEAYLRDNGLEGAVRIHGAVSDRRAIRDLLIAADVFVLPTYYPVEAQPRSIIEALNAGVPVVATRHASIPEYVTDGDNGYLVEARSPDRIAASLRRLTDPDEWRARASAARRSYEELFDSDVLRGQLLDVFLGSENLPAPALGDHGRDAK